MIKTRDPILLSETLLDKIMLLFWNKGYFETSLQDLALVMNISRAMLSRHFGGKRGLFQAMLLRFRNRVEVEATLSLQDPSLGMDGIKAFFQQFIECSRVITESDGCLLIMIAANLAAQEPEAALVIEEFIHHLRSLFYKNLRWQQSEKRLDPEVNLEIAADFLVGNVVGLMTLLRSGSDPVIVQHQVQSIIQYFSTLTIRKHSSQVNLHLII